MSSWRETRLWRVLEARHSDSAESVKTTLKPWLEEIEEVLSGGGTAPLDFTLHDSGHSFRVAERMAEIVPDAVLEKLTDYEIALLILAAYLHDIGMTPKRQKVESHYRFILAGGSLTPVEEKEFQKWLDDQGYAISPPLTDDIPLDQRLAVAGEVVTYYCRYRHNDWSGEWVRERGAGKALGTYYGWLDDLIRLCRSHHNGYQELIGSPFNPRLVGSPAEVVHLRYLAVVLRVADVLEFDPERTPDVLFRHRGIQPKSLIYWWKDKEISLTKEGDRLIAFARPESALLHRAIELTLDQIDDELRLCQRLAAETHFEVCPGMDERLPHRWDLGPALHRNLEPKGGTYEYVDGSFRPDTRKILELLSGLAMYGDPLAAVRELLQNAFDAVREQIAYERLERLDPADSGLERQLGRLHFVRLRLETSGSEAWLVCSDDGVGMTKSIIRDHVLVSGTARRHDILDLERRCEAAGFRLGRTGQFGIGVLSYFILGDRVVMNTLRSQQAGDTEACGWSFVTEGIGSFGELRRRRDLKRGTEVRIRLKGGVFRDPSSWYSALVEYVRRNLCHVPCEFRLDTGIAGCAALAVGPGWSPLPAGLGVSATRRARYGEAPPGLLPESDRAQREAYERLSGELRREAFTALRWTEPADGELPDGLGSYRLEIPYFELPHGVSLVFLRVSEADRGLLIEPMGLTSRGFAQSARRGIHVSLAGDLAMSGWVYQNWPSGVYGRIDWRTARAGSISVDRGTLTPTRAAEEMVQWLAEKAEEFLAAFVSRHRSSVYDSLNVRQVRAPVAPPSRPYWASFDPAARTWAWKPVDYPATVMELRRSAVLGAQKVIPMQHIPLADRSAQELEWLSVQDPPQVVVTYDRYGYATPVWTGPSESERRRHPCGALCEFPPAWRHVCSIPLSTRAGATVILWNAEHPLAAFDEGQWAWIRANLMDPKVDPRAFRNELTGDRGKAAAFITSCLVHHRMQLWNGLAEKDRPFMERIWSLVFPPGSGGAAHTEVRYGLSVLKPEGWFDYTGFEEEARLPDPGEEWTLKEGSRGGST